MLDLNRLAEALTERALTVAVGESATGGLLSYLLSSAPGASRYFLGAVTAYANDAKSELLAVPDDAFAGGAVSEPVALAMARGARALFRADVAIADTGIAGPGGATDTKPVGLFYVALSARRALSARDGYETVRTLHLTGDREQVRRAAADAALTLLAEYADALPTP
ncbi:MAG: nicotinamide-nucleotide amidohydrolase family protein [Chloroflexi bacterium]|nr:nicotinamide-nucleotide amidohydrolase family protein [Chloroflexota bacterium]